MNYPNADASFFHGIRVNYRLIGRTDVVTQDFFGPTKGVDSEAFANTISKQSSWLVFTVVVPE
jgi:hypothetical protein